MSSSFLFTSFLLPLLVSHWIFFFFNKKTNKHWSQRSGWTNLIFTSVVKTSIAVSFIIKKYSIFKRNIFIYSHEHSGKSNWAVELICTKKNVNFNWLWLLLRAEPWRKINGIVFTSKFSFIYLLYKVRCLCSDLLLCQSLLWVYKNKMKIYLTK